MNIKQKITVFLVAMAVFTGVSVATAATTAFAAKCGNAETSIISCSQKGGAKNLQDNPIWGLLLLGLNIMTAGVGILAVGGVTYASILYASSSDNAEQTKQAKQIIKSVAIGIVAYASMYLALNFLIPGGIFK